MSTGSDLLLRLRQQQQHHQKQKNKKLKNDEIATYNAAAAGTTTATSVERASPQKATDTTATKTTIEVCLGPDCSGLGGGAALLEIEEIISCRAKRKNLKGDNNCANMDNNKAVVAVPGGCRDFCTMGPNVHVSGGNDGHYSKVDRPEICRAVVDSVYGEEETAVVAATASTGDASAITFLSRRKDGIRWRSHRERAGRERRLKVRERSVS